ncbi:pseudouridine synthase [Cokeromyces recurvatus]|uniref:pseudouridine synthase n=1 Tax=Cokeromyces recurvatus TaxID=90255 RepID=UPI00221ECD7C|nr:pseudouridine synthase [Cokeromyces recurvatus]KAI7902588.1 pseudouridine synthase [Cokeromyces recurvatus]
MELLEARRRIRSIKIHHLTRKKKEKEGWRIDVIIMFILQRNQCQWNKRKKLLATLWYKNKLFTTNTLKEETDLDTANYYFENGFRKVKPYYFQFRVFAKQRMIGKTVLNAFLSEFRGRSEQYYKDAIEKGLVTVNYKPTTPDSIIKNQDLLNHFVHRHEPPVTDQPIEIIYEDDRLFVINKPSNIQVHPGGRFRHNTVIHVMRKELNYDTLFPLNRLDRYTSGLMIICKSSINANSIAEQMRSAEIQKEYLCRVSGKFPREQIICEAPIKTLSYKVSFNYIHPEGKACRTLFERISYDGDTSLIRCKPLTGRTHQIRIHLRHLGFPITNDPIYGYKTPWTSMLTKNNFESVIDSMIEHAPYDYMDDDPSSTLPRCSECNIPLIQDGLNDTKNSLWLHAYKYTGKDWSFETPSLPVWVNA